MKKYKLLLLFTLIHVIGFSQAKRPSIMVVPSDVWCNENNCMTGFDNQGAIQKIPDYKKALLNNDMYLVINKIGEMMSERGFPLQDLGMTMKLLETNEAFVDKIDTGDNSKIVETPLDKLLRTAKVDIVMFVSWSLNVTGPNKSVTFIIQGADSYSSIQVASASGTSPKSYSADVPLMLTQSILTYIDQFNNQLQSHFDDILDNGRTVKLTCRLSENSAINYMSRIDGVLLSRVIGDMIYNNTVKGVFNTNISTRSVLEFKMRIPLFMNDSNGNARAIDTSDWTMNYLQDVLYSKYKIDTQVNMKGLGEVFLTIL